MSLPRMRTVPEAMAEIKKADPETALTLRALRRMVKNGEIPVIMNNTRRLINLDVLYERLNGEHSDFAASSPQSKIRRIG